MIATVDALSFVLFAGLLFIGALTTTRRLLRWLVRRESPPRLLTRDFLTQGGLAIVLLAILTARAFDLGPTVQEQLWWHIFTGGLGVFSVAVYVYFELFVIGSRR